MKKISISLIFLIASSLTFTNDLLNGNHQVNPQNLPKGGTTTTTHCR